MFLKLGNTYYAELDVVDSTGRKVDDDLPLMTVQDIDTKEYYNGVVWQKAQIALALMPAGNGVYYNEFVPDREGNIKVTLESTKYNCSKIEQIEVYEEVNDKHNWQCGRKYIIEYSVPRKVDGALYCNIANESTGEYWDGYKWNTNVISLPLSPISGGKYGYSFTPKEVGAYCITVVCGDKQYHYILNVVETAKNIAPVIVSNNSLLSLDGSDSTVIADNGVPVDKAEVIVYDPDTKEVVAKTSTNQAGEWQLLLEPGVWFFTFQRDGYVSISFERTVS